MQYLLTPEEFAQLDPKAIRAQVERECLKRAEEAFPQLLSDLSFSHFNTPRTAGEYVRRFFDVVFPKEPANVIPLPKA